MKTLSVLLILTSSLLAHSDMTKCVFSENDTGITDKTSLLKTFTADYWKVAKVEISKIPIALQKTGFVVGDFHFNNVGLYYDYQKGKPELVLNDFDDAGNNFLLVDLMKYLTYVQKLDKLIEKNELIHSYRAGLLDTSEISFPVDLNESQLKFNKDSQNYLNNHREEFVKFDKSKMNAEQNAKVQELARLKIITQLTQVDYMVKTNDSGSSKGMERFEFIGTARNGAVGLIEFKKLKCSATGAADAQDLSANFAFVKKSYLDNHSTAVSNQYVYRLRDESFLVRQKIFNPLKKLEIEKQSTQLLQKYSNFFAAYLGSVHSKSADKAYIDAIAEHEDLIIMTTKEISKKFKDVVQN